MIGLVAGLRPSRDEANDYANSKSTRTWTRRSKHAECTLVTRFSPRLGGKRSLHFGHTFEVDYLVCTRLSLVHWHPSMATLRTEWEKCNDRMAGQS